MSDACRKAYEKHLAQTGWPDSKENRHEFEAYTWPLLQLQAAGLTEEEAEIFMEDHEALEEFRQSLAG